MYLSSKSCWNRENPSFRAPPVSLDDTAFILYTSATTGPSKGVVLSQRNMSVNLQQARSWFPAFEDGKETVVGCLPFFHVFGNYLCP